MGVFVALLRGVNVGGHGLVSMKGVKASFERLGFRGVKTHLNSGNVIFEAEGGARALERKAEGALASECGIEAKVVVKSFREYEAIVRAWPAEWVDDEAWAHTVVFLRHTVNAEKLAKELRSVDGVDRLVACPGALLWSMLRSGAARSGVARANRLPVYREMTARNLRTVRKLYELMAERL